MRIIDPIGRRNAFVLSNSEVEDLWHKEAKRNTHLSKNEKPMTLRRDTKTAALAAKKLSAAPGQP